MQTLIPGLVLNPLAERSTESPQPAVREPSLILYAHQGVDTLVVIPTTVRQSAGRRYFLGPRQLSYSNASSQLNALHPSLTIHPFTARSATNLTDDQLNRKFMRKGQSKSVPLTKLELSWMLIEPLVSNADKVLLFEPKCRSSLIAARATEIVADSALAAVLFSDQRNKQVKRGRSHDDSQPGRVRRVQNELQRLLNQFWANGSIRGALIGFADACGGRGEPKRAGTKKRGAPNAAVREGHLERAGINVEEGSDDAKIIKFCYDTWVIRGTTESTALRRMWTEFYSVAVQQSDGTTLMEWLPPQNRPTASHFRYWGTKGDRGSVAWRKQLPPTKFDKSYRAVMGSASDDVYAIGQRGGIDSTPPDIQLVRALDRVARVGGAHRIIVIDTMFGYIPGLYMGFDAPSAKTVRLALYNSMDPDKEQWLEDLSLDDLPPEDFIPMWFENLWADNTDLRNKEIMECAKGINTNIHFVPKLRSDFNPMAESAHHIMHRLVDHKMLGTTHGRMKERGESSATDRARHTLLEAIRETVRAQHVHNTAEIPDNRPLRLRLKNVPSTRLNMTRELIRTVLAPTEN